MTTHTCSKEYGLRWLNINPDEKRIEALFSVNVILDTEETATLPDIKLIAENEDYDSFYNKIITYIGQDSKIGDVILTLLSEEAQRQCPEIVLQ